MWIISSYSSRTGMYSSYCESVVLDLDRPVMELVELLRKN